MLSLELAPRIGTDEVTFMSIPIDNLLCATFPNADMSNHVLDHVVA
jgi:hypothetical protein